MVTFVSINVCGLGEGKRRHLRSWLTAKDGGAAPDFLSNEFERVLGARIGDGEDDNPVWDQIAGKISGKVDLVPLCG